MGKIGVIIGHEYTTRVKSKWFIISTLLGPIGMAVLITIPVLAATLAGDGTVGKVAILDRSNGIGVMVAASDTSMYEIAGNRNEATLAREVQDEKLQAYVVVPAEILDSGRLVMYSRGGSGLSFESSVSNDFEPFIVKARLLRVGTDTAVIGLVEKGVDMTALKITDTGVVADSSTASAAIGYVAGFVIYMLIFLYGSMVMRGVVEEKASRIIEVIASSVKPYEIMMGKVVGIGLVGLTQLVAWFVLGAIVVLTLAATFGGSVDPQTLAESSKQMQQMQQMSPAGPQASPMMIGDVAFPNISFLAVVLFIFFFLAGYFIYATLFAAVGSAVDQEADASQLTLPIMLPVIVTVMFIGNVVAAPNGTLAVVLSLIPLFTPILMTVRIAATDVPLWQILASVVLTTATFFGTVWLASRIYRIGILTYGKKPSLKEILRWIR